MKPKNQTNPLQQAVDTFGMKRVAEVCGVTYQNVQYWLKTGLPRTEFTGETSHAQNIANLAGGAITQPDLLAWSTEQRKQHRRTA